MPNLEGQTILIIGARSGIGRTIAASAAAAGARPIVAGRSADAADQLARQIPGVAGAVGLDLADEKSIASAAGQLGSVDHIVSLAADHANGAVTNLDVEQIDRAFRAKVTGPLLIAKHFASHMPAGGSLVLFSGYVAQRPAPGLTVMATTNGAVEALVPALAVDLAPVRVIGISPGVIDSGAWDSMGNKAEFFAEVRSTNAARRVGSPSDIADAVLFACSNRFLTATTLHVDGGQRVA